MTTRKYL